ncbi:MAG: SgcJ/EcaC family oxidoreductase [Deltaproteobacteria bacterium]|nr:SgcJ/EcaC family oxidoreductase [Deltaproteobacteria bacterium]MCW5806090.1 SgcJ/EcaC family oxidoreductase [Deltaproteobacteria bacterium]
MTVEELYRQIIDAWNARDAEAFAALFTVDGEIVGFDGSQATGRGQIHEHLKAVFDSHETMKYVGVVDKVTTVTTDVAIVHAVVGMVSKATDQIEPKLNAVQRLVGVHRSGDWRAALLQTTPAAYHGRPDDVARLTATLTAARASGDNAR